MLIVEPEEFTFAEGPNALLLENGQRLGPITIRFECYGTLNRDKSNAILILHAFSGDAHAAGRHHADDERPGWWDSMIGSGRAFDTDRFFVVCPNVLGGCQGSTGPSSVNPETGKPYGMSFPVITIKDMVNTQHHLMRHFGVERWYAVAGGSMGGMQALEWMVHYPHTVERTVLIATTSSLSAQALAFSAVGRSAITSDPHWNKGDYYGKTAPTYGLSIARMLAHITYVSDTSLGEKFGRRLQTRKNLELDFDDRFAVENYLEYQGLKFVDRFDANTYLYLSKAMDYFDLTSYTGSIESALEASIAKFLIVSFSSDWRFPPQTSKELVHALIRSKHEVSYVELDCPFGHDCFLLEIERQTEIIRAFLKS